MSRAPFDDSKLAVKTVPFSGKKDDFYIWITQFMSFADYYKCLELPESKMAIPPDSPLLNPTDPAD
jgi:hypothetical protein